MSAAAKRTPGPWTVVTDPTMLGDDEEFHTSYYIESRGVGHIGHIETIADARLIAAAPELLAALQGCADALAKMTAPQSIGYAELVAARAAIAKVSS